MNSNDKWNEALSQNYLDLIQNRESAMVIMEEQSDILSVQSISTNKAGEAVGLFDDSLSPASAVEDTLQHGTGLSLIVGSTEIPLGESGLTGLKCRLNAACTGIENRLTEQQRCQVLSTMLQNSRNELTKLFVSDGKVRGAGTVEYTPISSSEVLRALQAQLNERMYGKWTFHGGYVDHRLTVVQYSLPGLKPVLSKRENQNLIPGMQYLSSECGFASAQVGSCWINPDTGLLIAADSVGARHRGDARVDTLMARVDGNVFPRIRKTAEVFARLMDFPLKYPEMTFLNACRRLTIPKKYWLTLSHRWEAFCTTYCDLSGYDLFSVIQEVSQLANQDSDLTVDFRTKLADKAYASLLILDREVSRLDSGILIKELETDI